MSSGADRDTDRDWSLIAETEPYWGVISHDRYKSANFDEDAHREFFDSGDIFIQHIFSFVRKHIIPDFNPERSLDFGCGVGRLLIPLAKVSREAVGVDVAPEMLRLCRENIQRFGTHNAIAIEGDDSLSTVEGMFDFINSYIVLQHIPPQRGYKLIEQLLDKLNRGGVASLQLTFAKSRRFLPHEISRARYYRREGGIMYDLGPEQGLPQAGTITMYDYDLNQVMSLMVSIAGAPVLVLPTNHDDHLGAHFIFARG